MNCPPTPRHQKFTVQFNLDIGCNANCFMCDKRIRIKRSRNTYKNLINYLQFLDPDMINNIKLQGGEPLLDKNGLLLFLKNCRSKGFQCVFPTNGSLLTQSFTDSLILMGLREITISLDSYKAEEHDKIRGLPGMYKRIVSNLMYIRKQYPNLKLYLNFLVLPQNIDSLEKMISFSVKLGITGLNVLYVEDFGRNFDKIQLSPLNKNKLESMKSAHISSKIIINWNPCSVHQEPGCYCRPNKIIVFEEGDINFCEHYPFTKKYFLDRPLQDILEEQEIKQFLNHNTRYCTLNTRRSPLQAP